MIHWSNLLVRWLRYQNAKRRFRREFSVFQAMNAQSSRLPMPWDEVRRCLDDRDTPASFDRHYFYHLAWAARILAERRPVRHVDISSQNLFVATVSAFLPIESYEFHPLPVELSNLKAGKADLCQLPFPDHSVPSVSCMHAVEHVGLGRYGDRLDPDGDLKAMGELRRVLAPGGQLLFVVPVGRPRVVFNAHRIYPYEQICEAFGDLELKEFALIPDDATRGHLLRHADPGLVQQQVYACGCFHFVEARARPSTANTQE